jgi:hypothetical protein
MDYPGARRQQLLQRLDAIGESLSGSDQALALIGLGSVGLERDRLDEYSDLDFFVIVSPGNKMKFIQSLDWLERVHPVAYRFQNTPDGYKLLFADGIFCEFAVFEPQELAGIPFEEGMIIWKHAEVEESIARPIQRSLLPGRHPGEWLIGEAVTNLYVGLCRYRRGEKLSAARFIQGYAVDRLLELAAGRGVAPGVPPDPFAIERRCERLLPELAGRLPEFIAGYEHSPDSARAILKYLESEFQVDAHMAAAIRLLIDG